MPRAYAMNWDGAPNYRWRKMHKGVKYVVTCEELGAPGTKKASGDAATAWWRRKMGELDSDCSQKKAVRNPTEPCWLCLWDVTGCDRHRIKHGEQGGVYVLSNILVLCPCCHRIAHRKPNLFMSEICRAVLTDKPITGYFKRLLPALMELPCQEPT